MAVKIKNRLGEKTKSKAAPKRKAPTVPSKKAPSASTKTSDLRVGPASFPEVRFEKTPKASPAKPTPHDGETDLALKARKGLGVTQEVFARMIGVSARSVAGWEAGRPINEVSRRRIREMIRLAASLREVMRPGFVPQWLVRPNEGLGGLSPVQVLEHGETDRLWRAVFLLGSGLTI